MPTYHATGSYLKETTPSGLVFAPCGYVYEATDDRRAETEFWNYFFETPLAPTQDIRITCGERLVIGEPYYYDYLERRR